MTYAPEHEKELCDRSLSNTECAAANPLGKHTQPGAAIVDPQGAKTTGVGDEGRGNGGKKVRGRKRYLLGKYARFGAQSQAWRKEISCQDGSLAFMYPSGEKVVSRQNRGGRRWTRAAQAP